MHIFPVMYILWPTENKSCDAVLGVVGLWRFLQEIG